MAVSINWSTRVIFIPKADLTFVSGSTYSLNIDAFRLELKDLEDSEEGIAFPTTHTHNTAVFLAGVTYARSVEIINGYTVEFEDGMYTAQCTGANHNLSDVKVVNSVSLIIGNSAGLISAGGAGSSAAELWTYANRQLTVGTRDSEIDSLVTSVDSLPVLTEIEASSVLAREASVTARPTLSQIEASSVLAKEATSQLIKTKTDTLPDGIAKNTALNNFEFAMIDSVSHITFKTGLTITAQRSIDGGAFASCSNAASEVGNGVYKIDLSAADLNGNVITFLFTATGADARLITLVTS